MLQAVMTALPLLILEIDEDGNILEYNSDSPSLFDVQINSFLNNHIRAFFPENANDQIDTALMSFRNGGRSPLINYTLSLEDGEHWFEARFIPPNKKNGMVIIQDITRYKMSEAKIQKQLDQMSALRSIDRAITSSVDLNLTLSILLSELVNQLQIDTACILLWNPDSQRLEYGAGLGFRTNTLSHTKLKLGEGYAGVAALEQRIIQIKDISYKNSNFVNSPKFGEEDFVSYIGVPLVAKGVVQGVLEIFNRTLLDPRPAWISFLEMIGDQAAIAIDNTSLFNNLQQSNAEIISAYDATIEGWSRALDLRDQSTEGHTQRVTKLSVRLASKLNMPSGNLLHIQRGATLHDIGKMGVPDYILHKPGPLSEYEWEIIRQHPKFANDLLSPIEYLRQAKDIPYKHHERWDGSGYPLGLKGDEIPLAARLFAIVDVYDALISDRPYRPAWTKQEAKKYIRDQAGELFDPYIVPIFLELLNNGEYNIPSL